MCKIINGKLGKLVDMIQSSNYTVSLTGAGVSTDSGIPDFRSEDSGLWQETNPMEVASYRNFRENPDRFYSFWKDKFSRITEAAPNITHKTLAKMEGKELLDAVITQNIDNLHREAGSENVYECHGNYKRGYCIKCNRPVPTSKILEKVDTKGVPRCSECGGLLKPDVVLFGESLPDNYAECRRLVKQFDLLICLGTSLTVYPVADLLSIAKNNQAKVAIINRDPTPFDEISDLLINAELEPVMTQLKRLLDLNH